MTKETIKNIELFEKAKKYSEGLPEEERGSLRTIGFYDCLCRCQPLVDCIESMKKQYGNSEWIVRACDEALTNYNKDK